MKTITIRNPKIEETGTINAFMKFVLEDTFKKNELLDLNNLLIEEIEEKRLCLEAYFDANEDERAFFIALCEDQIIGTIEYRLSSDLIKECTHNELDGLYEMGTVFVHPDYQAQGVGSLLLRHLYEVLDEIGIAEICFDSGYKSAQKIWTNKFGKPKYFVKDHWGEEAHHMVWHVNIKESLKLL